MQCVPKNNRCERNVIRFQPLTSIYLLKNEVRLSHLEERLPDLVDPFISTNPIDVFQYGQDVYHERQAHKKDVETSSENNTASVYFNTTPYPTNYDCSTSV